MQGELTQEKKSNIQGDITVDEKFAMMNLPENINAGEAEPLETRLLDVYKGRAKLAYPRLEPGNATTQFTLEPEQLTLQDGLDVTPGTMAAQVSVYETGQDVRSEGVVYTALGQRRAFGFKFSSGACSGRTGNNEYYFRGRARCR